MARGRKPTPTNLKLLAGNPGKRKINRKEPDPGKANLRTPDEFLVSRAETNEEAVGFKPPHAANEAAKAYQRLSKKLNTLGLLSSVDVELLSAFCQAYGQWKEASAMVNKLGMVTKTSNGNLVQNPFVAIVNRQAQIMAKLGSEFGFTPSSRSRLEVSGEEPDDPLSKLLNRRNA